MYQDKPVGQPPVPPAQLGLATILQAYTGASDDEVIEACVMDRRWQLVLDCMDHAQLGHALVKVVGVLARQQGGGWWKGPGCWPARRACQSLGRRV
jgi:hypothetical protein